MSDGKNQKSDHLSRRNFIKTSCGLATGAGLLSAGAFSLPATARAEVPKKWDEEVDVVVLGSGFAGLAAAYEAKKAGASVVVLEKMRVPGGNSIINGGVVAAAGSPKQAAEGIKDSPDLLYEDMLKAGLRLNHPELARMVAEQSAPIVQWTIDELGVEYMEKVTHLGGHSVPRSYCTHNRSGSAIVQKQLAKLGELGVKVRTGTFLTGLVKDETGRVAGVLVKAGYKFPDENSGKPAAIRAKKAVVLATGGFCRDLAFRTIQDPTLIESVDSTNHPGATAEGLLQALAIGATPVQVSWIQLGPWASPDEKGFGIAPHFAAGGVFIDGMMVDPKTGKRFINELADRKIRADAILKTGHPAIGLVDAVVGESAGLKGITEANLKAGTVKKFDSLEALAEGYGIPFKEFKEEVDRYNSFVKEGKDGDFGRYIHPGTTPMEKPPFYAVRLWPKVHHTMGGLQINSKAQVMDLGGGPIPGLYAAGEVAGGVHGAVRLGSCATADCLIFGRIAGVNAAGQKA